jgi:hypothetical protein
MNKERILIKVASDTITLGTIFAFCYKRGIVFNNPNLSKETLGFLMVGNASVLFVGLSSLYIPPCSVPFTPLPRKYVRTFVSDVVSSRNGMLIRPVQERG